VSRRAASHGPATGALLALPVWLIVIVCSGLPLAWLAWQIVTAPSVLGELHVDVFRAGLLGRTLAYNLLAAILATVLALPVAQVIGRGRGPGLAAMWVALPISLLLPSITYAYGWSQFVRLTGGWWERTLGLEFVPGSGEDVLRCIWSLACWLWPVPAAAIGLSLRRMDSAVQQQALLDGALWRVTARRLVNPIVASAAVVAVLAMQEFAVFEPTGISVLATEVRMVFDTGAVSSSDNPISAPLGGGPEAPGVPDQRHRAAAAVVTSIPLLAAIAALSLAARRLHRREEADALAAPASWPRVLDAGPVAWGFSVLVVLIAVGVPLAALAISLKTPVDPLRLWRTFQPPLTGSMIVATLSGLVALALGGAVLAARAPGALGVMLVSFLVGGQLLAIALIRLYNRPWLSVVYNGAPIIIMAYLARFGWVAVLAGRAGWQGPWRELREQASVDGAAPLTTAARVIAPLAWPALGASAVLVAILSLSEVPATVLITPMRPQLLTPLLMSWVHMLRYDPMIEGSLLLVGVVIALTLIAVGLGRLGLGMVAGRRPCAIGLFMLAVAPLGGCGDASLPQAIWCQPGTAEPQLVYPRAVAYSPADDSFVVIDRTARVQRIDPLGHLLNQWAMPEKLKGKPVGVSVSTAGEIYVPDTHYHRVMVYSPEGQLLRQWGSLGREPGQFIYPTDIAFDASGHVFVSEYGDNDRIQVFGQKGEFRYAFGRFGSGDGEFIRPQSLVIDGESVYVADAVNHRINVFRTSGEFVRNMGSIGSGPGQLRYPYGLDMDAQGRLVVSEFGNNRVQLIDKQTGAGLGTWGSPGHDPGQLAYPWASAADTRRGRIVAVDSGNNRLQVFAF
jgi:ABC-type Fe3+ transport system permease subunit/sugar lactone lactonase YvrE